jgi:putative FmdB family regulatory protein
MPIYEFHCGKCEKDSEILVRSSNWKGAKCPVCGSTRLTKKLSVFASQTVEASGGAPACAMGGPRKTGCGCSCAGGKHRH